jgi:hypothetical protein
MRAAPEEAEQHRQTVFLRQAIHLLINCRSQLPPGCLVFWAGFLTSDILQRDSRSHLRRQTQAISDAVQPARQGGGIAQRTSLPGQDEPGGLEGILGGMRITCHPQAHSPDHRAVPLDQGVKGGFIFCLGVTFEQE